MIRHNIFDSEKQYHVIYADPPWKESGGGRIKRGADRHYPLMTTKTIASLPVKSIARPNAHLYLWVTNNFLPDGLRVMGAWGFRYVTMITWPKKRIGLGQYFRGRTEHCLFGVRGMLPYKMDGTSRCQGTTLLTPCDTGQHSKKPEEMRKLIEHVSMRSGFQAIELFARKDVCGWDVWGEELR